MGIITMALVAGGFLAAPVDAATGRLLAPHVPLWVVLAAHSAIAAGTAAGGWRIVKTMGTKITKLTPFGGFCAETGGGATILLASLLGVPVSTTHTITGAIVGVGTSRRVGAVRWAMAGRIVWAWILTIPMSALIAAMAFALGGALGAIAVATRHEIVLGIIGGLFVVEAMSVIIQVFYFKRTGKRIFRMAPIHHHFEQLGWSEPTVVIRFWIIAFVLAMAGLATLKLR